MEIMSYMVRVTVEPLRFYCNTHEYYHSPLMFLLPVLNKREKYSNQTSSVTLLYNLSLVHPDFMYLTENAIGVIQSTVSSPPDELTCT